MVNSGSSFFPVCIGMRAGVDQRGAHSERQNAMLYAPRLGSGPKESSRDRTSPDRQRCRKSVLMALTVSNACQWSTCRAVTHNQFPMFARKTFASVSHRADVTLKSLRRNFTKNLRNIHGARIITNRLFPRNNGKKLRVISVSKDTLNCELSGSTTICALEVE